MFIQVLQGKVADADLVRRMDERWLEELKPGAKGYLGYTGGVTPDGRYIGLARFESAEAAQANSDRPEQTAWWNEAVKGFDGEPTVHDCTEVDTPFGGGSNGAGSFRSSRAAQRTRRSCAAWARTWRVISARPALTFSGWSSPGTATGRTSPRPSTSPTRASVPKAWRQRPGRPIRSRVDLDRRSLRLSRIGGHLWTRPGFGVTLIRRELEAAGLGDHDRPAAVSLFAWSEHTPMTIGVFTSKARTLRKGFIVSHRPSMTAWRSNGRQERRWAPPCETRDADGRSRVRRKGPSHSSSAIDPAGSRRLNHAPMNDKEQRLAAAEVSLLDEIASPGRVPRPQTGHIGVTGNDQHDRQDLVVTGRPAAVA